jgi:hypothetical protein
VRLGQAGRQFAVAVRAIARVRRSCRSAQIDLEGFGDAADGLQIFTRQIELLRQVVLFAQDREDFAELDRVDAEVFFEARCGVKHFERIARHLREDFTDAAVQIVCVGECVCCAQLTAPIRGFITVKT